VKKTDIAHTFIRKAPYPMKRISDALQISKSNEHCRGIEKRGCGYMHDLPHAKPLWNRPLCGLQIIT